MARRYLSDRQRSGLVRGRKISLTIALDDELNYTVQFYEPTSDSTAGWNSHAYGVARLMFVRGPDRHRSPFGRALLEGIRLSAVSSLTP